MKRRVGRPAKWTTPEALRKDVDRYFEQPGPHSVAGLCLHLGCCKQTFHNYRGRDEFAWEVERARIRIMAEYELVGMGIIGKGGAVFADRMLTRMGWPCVEQKRQQAETTAIIDGGSVLQGAGNA